MTNNSSTPDNPVGRFMVASGAMIVNSAGKILLLQRSSDLDWQSGEWEILYGRIAQGEGAAEGLVREVKEESNIEIEIQQPLTIWHIYRGEEELPENELIGITFLCEAKTEDVQLSDEHEQYKWVTSEEALSLVKVKGIRRDIEAYANLLSSEKNN